MIRVSQGFMYELTKRVSCKVIKKAIFKNMSQQLQAAGHARRGAQEFLMCEYIRSHFVGNCKIS